MARRVQGDDELGEYFGRAVGEILQECLSERDLARWRERLAGALGTGEDGRRCVVCRERGHNRRTCPVAEVR